VFARWLTKQGAGHLVLTGRKQLPDRTKWTQLSESDPCYSEAQAILSLENNGSSVQYARVSIDNEQDMSSLINRISQTMPPIRGIIHSAGVIRDGVLENLGEEEFNEVLAPKLYGTWILHRLTVDQPIDFFVLFSSVASIFGSAGQGNHAAANAFMDALAHYRWSRGLPAVSINWGAWSEVGAATRSDWRERLKMGGIDPISPVLGVEVFNQVIQESSPQITVIPINWEQFFQSFPNIRERAFYEEVISENSKGNSANSLKEKDDLTIEAFLAQRPEDRRKFLEKKLVRQCSQVMRLVESKIDVRRPLISMGLDSLMAVDFKNRIEKKLGLSISLQSFLKTMSIETLTEDVLSQLTDVSVDQGVNRVEEILKEVESLSDEETQKILSQLDTTEKEHPV